MKGPGQLLTVYGTHPRSGEPYRYVGSAELRHLRPADLPLIAKKQVQLFWEAILPHGNGRGRRDVGGGKTGITFLEAMRGVDEGRRHAAMMTIASALRGWGCAEEEARQRVADAAARCRPALPVGEAYDVVAWVFRKFQPGRTGEGVHGGTSAPTLLKATLRRTLGDRTITRVGRYEVFKSMCRDLQRYLGEKPVGLPQSALAQILKCSQQAVSKLIRRRLEEGILLLENGHYLPGRRAKLYRVIG